MVRRRIVAARAAQMDRGFAQMDHGFAQVEREFATVHAGLRQIVGLIEGITPE